jgi:hypothetical protein
VIGAYCQWCLVSATLATLTFLFSLPEIRRLGLLSRAGPSPDAPSLA